MISLFLKLMIAVSHYRKTYNGFVYIDTKLEELQIPNL